MVLWGYSRGNQVGATFILGKQIYQNIKNISAIFHQKTRQAAIQYSATKEVFFLHACVQVFKPWDFSTVNVGFVSCACVHTGCSDTEKSLDKAVDPGKNIPRRTLGPELLQSFSINSFLINLFSHVRIRSIEQKSRIPVPLLRNTLYSFCQEPNSRRVEAGCHLH